MLAERIHTIIEDTKEDDPENLQCPVSKDWDPVLYNEGTAIITTKKLTYPCRRKKEKAQ